MVATRKRFHRSIAKLSIAAFACASFGAAVAAPIMFVPKSNMFHAASTSTYAPLASGTAIQLAKAGAGESEDCVRVTHMTGPDGKEYPTRGIVCGGNAD